VYSFAKCSRLVILEYFFYGTVQNMFLVVHFETSSELPKSSFQKVFKVGILKYLFGFFNLKHISTLQILKTCFRLSVPR